MRIIHSMLVALAVSASATVAGAQTPAASPAPTDVYHVMFVKAAPGQAAALAKELQEADPKNPTGSHFILLRHQEGADWDYCLIEHVGTKASVEITPPPPTTGTPTRAWHEDTFVSGPAWPEFQRVTGLTGDQSGSPVYVVGTHRAVPGHREQLLAALNQPPAGSKPAPAGLTMTHMEGAQWQFLTVTRYNSWQELGADRTATTASADGWAEIRQHSASHNDTIADRVK